jgi:nucleolar protein 15
MAEELSSIVYIGHLPESFEEKQMRKFFSQFGNIKNLQLSRSRKTGNSKHYGWLEFDSPQIAAIVAKSMHKYLLFTNVIDCHLARVHPMLFKNARRGPKKPKPPQQRGRRALALKLAR